MTNSFLTLEDINGTLYRNQSFWWYELDLSLIDPTGDAEFTDVKVDFLTISRENITTSQRKYTIVVDNDLWTKRVIGLSKYNYTVANLSDLTPLSDSSFEFHATRGLGFLWLYMGNIHYSEINTSQGYLQGRDTNLMLPYNEIGQEKIVRVHTGGSTLFVPFVADIGYNRISYNDVEYGYVFVKLLKTDFQFNCNQQLTVGEVNTVQLGTDSDYKVGGDLVGEYETKLSVLYNNKTIPVVWNSQLNDYTFDLDLTNIQSESKIRFKVIVETNDVLNHSETDVVLDANYESINTLSKLQNLFKIGGTGRITSNLTLTNDLTLSKDVYLISENKTITMDGHKIIVPSDKTFKAQNLTFTGGVNTIQQNVNTKVELNQCTFTNCTGLGSVIDCQIDANSLNTEDDFTTIINNCTFTNNDLCILHGGTLTITDCTVNGKISDKNYPYFLYQTDGTAIILQSQFNISSNTQITSDIEFNPCIFTCGETALINGHNHTELQNNNLTSFLTTQRNTSTIDLTYKYSLINDYIRLKTSKGFCHNVSGIDYVFKTNVTPERI